jgi:pimeloyl-ACP methyl ester carboxylesterase
VGRGHGPARGGDRPAGARLADGDRARGVLGAERLTRAGARGDLEAFEEFIDFYNGPGAFARWPASRRDRFLDVQRARGDLWDVLFEAPLNAGTLGEIPLPVHVVEGSATSLVDHAICDVVRHQVPRAEHTLIDGAGHMIPLTHAPQLTRALVGWITR